MFFSGVDGQYIATIVSNPIGTPVNGFASAFDYPILSNVTLTCMVDPSPPAGATYWWITAGCYSHPDHNSGNPSCFPTGQTTQTITGKGLTAADAGTIACTVTIIGVDYTSGPLTLHISGMCMHETDENTHAPHIL